MREWPSVHDNCYGGRKFHGIESAHLYIIKDFVKLWIEIEKELHVNEKRLFGIFDVKISRIGIRSFLKNLLVI